LDNQAHSPSLGSIDESLRLSKLDRLVKKCLPCNTVTTKALQKYTLYSTVLLFARVETSEYPCSTRAQPSCCASSPAGWGGASLPPIPRSLGRRVRGCSPGRPCAPPLRVPSVALPAPELALHAVLVQRSARAAEERQPLAPALEALLRQLRVQAPQVPQHGTHVRQQEAVEALHVRSHGARSPCRAAPASAASLWACTRQQKTKSPSIELKSELEASPSIIASHRRHPHRASLLPLDTSASLSHPFLHESTSNGLVAAPARAAGCQGGRTTQMNCAKETAVA